MVSVIILDSGEANVVQLTFENLYRELKDIYGSELLIRDRWFDLEGVKNKYVCFVEADCLVSEGYFKILLQDFMKKGSPRNEAVMSSSTAVSYWHNKIYGYNTDQGLRPNREKRSSSLFSVQVAYIPGSIIRLSMLKPCLKDLSAHDDLVQLSAELSMAFWKRSAELKGKGYRVYLNPKVSYLTTEDYVNDLGELEVPISQEVVSLFQRESI